jgi:opacity protein-like surface antigen
MRRATCSAGVTLLAFLLVFQTSVQAAKNLNYQAGIGLQAFIPTGDEVKDAYSFGVGLSGDAGIVYKNQVTLSLGVAPTYSPGNPVAGPLASDAGASLFSLPITATLQVAIVLNKKYRPYVGVGWGAYYVREKLSFTGPPVIGDRDDTRSTTVSCFNLMAGFEQNRPKRFFGELWYNKVSVFEVEDTGNGLAAGGIRLRVGYRGVL